MEPSDVLVAVCATVPTLGDAMHTLTKYVGTWTQAMRVEAQVDAAGATWISATRVRPTTRPGAALADEFLIADIVTTAGWLTGTSMAALAVHLAHPRGASLAAYRTAFGVTPTFGTGSCRVAYTAAQSRMPLLRHDPWLRSFTQTSVERVVNERARSTPASTVADRVRREVVLSFGRSVPDAPRIAQRLGWSVRTLRRRLQEEGASFSDVLDAARREEAMRLLGASGSTVAEVAARLGFSHLSSFHRACVRWTGLSPRTLRARTSHEASRGADI
jgi:AraC-like DNA-binding protein